MALADTAIGTTLSLGAYSGAIRSIDLDEESIPVLDKTQLNSTSTRKKAPAALRDVGGFGVVVLANLSTMLASPPPLTGTVVLGTITEPGGGTLVGGCFVDSRKVGSLENEEGLIESELHVTWTGYDDVAETNAGPVWTDA